MLAIIASIATVISFLLALLLHILGVGYGDLFVLIGLVCVGVWMVARSVPVIRR